MPSNPPPIIETVGELSDAAIEAWAALLVDAWEREQATLESEGAE